MPPPRLHCVVLVALAAFAFSALNGCASPAHLRPREVVLDAPGPIDLPARLCHGLFLVEARINGRGPYTMFVDSGASATVLSTRAASELRDARRTIQARIAEGAGGGNVPIRSAIHVQSLASGPLRISNFDAPVIDLSSIEESLQTRIDGVLGYPAFEGVLISFDYPARRIVLEQGELPVPDGREVLATTRYELPSIEVNIGDVRTTALVDTGFAGFLDIAGFKAHTQGSTPELSGSSHSIDGMNIDRAARLGVDVRFGRFTMESPIVGEAGNESLIGAEALREFVVTFDGANQRVRFTTSGDGRLHSPPQRSPGFIAQPRGGRWFIVRVMSTGSAAEAGLLEGDEVLECNGHPLKGSLCDSAWGSASQEPKLRLKILRRDQTFETVLDRRIVIP